MLAKIRIENQEILIESLKNSHNGYPDNTEEWTVDEGYIATAENDDRSTEGIEFKVLDEDTVAYRLSGDNREDGDWMISTAEDFWEIVMGDAEEFLAILKDTD